jgi:hypothetical protein
MILDPRRLRFVEEVAALLLALIAFSVVFSFYTGFSALGLVVGVRPVDQTVVSLESLAHLNNAPILIIPSGTSVLNSTYRVDVNGPLTVYEWWFYFQNSTVHPTPIAEPVYQYWNVYPWGANMLAVYVRFHFAARLIYGGWTLVNSTRLVVYFSQTFFIPTLGTGAIQKLLNPGSNATVLSNMQPVLDPLAPYPAGSTTSTSVYASGAAPVDPWVALNSPQTILNGVTFGAGAAVLVGAPVYTALRWVTLEKHPALRRLQRDLRSVGIVRRRDFRRVLRELSK